MIPLSLIVLYYFFRIAIATWVVVRFPGLGDYFPIGGIEELAASNLDTFEPVYPAAYLR